MFKAMKKIKKIKSKPVLVINHKNQYTANEWKQVRIIANHFTKRFKRDKPQTTMFRSSINTNENTIFKRRKYPQLLTDSKTRRSKENSSSWEQKLSIPPNGLKG